MVCTPYDVNKAQLQIFFGGGGGGWVGLRTKDFITIIICPYHTLLMKSSQ